MARKWPPLSCTVWAPSTTHLNNGALERASPAVPPPKQTHNWPVCIMTFTLLSTQGCGLHSTLLVTRIVWSGSGSGWPSRRLRLQAQLGRKSIQIRNAQSAVLHQCQNREMTSTSIYNPLDSSGSNGTHNAKKWTEHKLSINH